MVTSENIKTNIYTKEAKDLFLVTKPTKIQTPKLENITLEKGRVVSIQIDHVKGSVDYENKQKGINKVFYIIFDGKEQLSNILQNNDVNKDNFLNLDNFKYIGIGNDKYYTPNKKSIFGKEHTGKICNYPYPDDEYQLRLQLGPNNEKCPDYYAARHHPILKKITQIEPASETIEPPEDYCVLTNNCKGKIIKNPIGRTLFNELYGTQAGGKNKKRKTKSRNKRKTKSKTHKKSKKLKRKSKSKKQKNKKTKHK